MTYCPNCGNEIISTCNHCAPVPIATRDLEARVRELEGRLETGRRKLAHVIANLQSVVLCSSDDTLANTIIRITRDIRDLRILREELDIASSI